MKIATKPNRMHILVCVLRSGCARGNGGSLVDIVCLLLFLLGDAGEVRRAWEVGCVVTYNIIQFNRDLDGRLR
jgi:hypothetical protein